MSYETITETIPAQIEEIRRSIRDECVSIGELIFLADNVAFVDVDDIELIEAAGVPEHGAWDFHVPHEECEGTWDDGFPPQARKAWFRYYASWITRQPMWQCRRCGAEFTYVECGCHVAHVCDNS